MDIWNSELVQSIRNDLNHGHCCFCDECGLKRFINEHDPIPKQPQILQVLPRIFFEPTVLCNLSCFQAVCNKESGIVSTREIPQYPFEKFIELIDEIGKNLIRLDFFNYGDPMVHPQAIDMIEYLKKNYPHIYLYISTNGLMLNKNKIARLATAAVDEITFSVDGADQQTYEKYRCGGNYSQVLENMTAMVQQKQSLGREVPFINWRYILFNWNDQGKQMRKAVKTAEKIGIDRFTWEITDHPEIAVSKKYQPGTRGWKKIFYAIWDSNDIGSAIKSRQYLASLKSRQKKVNMSIGKPLILPIKVKNTGGTFWHKHTFSGRRIIRLGAQLYDQNQNLLNLNYARSFLNNDMQAKQSDWINIELPPLEQSGNYWLKFDMVSEGIDWFEHGGSTVLWMSLWVNPD